MSAVIRPYVNQGLMGRAHENKRQTTPLLLPDAEGPPPPLRRRCYIRNIVGHDCHHRCGISVYSYIPFVCGQWNPKNPVRSASIIAFSITPGSCHWLKSHLSPPPPKRHHHRVHIHCCCSSQRQSRTTSLTLFDSRLGRVTMKCSGRWNKKIHTQSVPIYI